MCSLCRRCVVPSNEKRSATYLTDLAKPLKVLMKEFNLERLLQASSLRLEDMKKDFRDAFTKICRILSINLISADICSYSNNWITRLIGSI